MKSESSPFVPKQDRRSFVKSQLIFALGACATGVNISKAYSAPSHPLSPVVNSSEELRAKYQECLGGPFPERASINTQIREITQKDGYRIESLTYESQNGEKIPALLLVPDRVNADHPAPAIAVWHQHNGQYYLGKSEPAGLAGNPMHFTGVALAKEGYVVLCPDALCFGERQDPTGKLKDGAYERFEFLREVVRGRSLAWRNVFEMKRAIDLLCSRPEVNQERPCCPSCRAMSRAKRRPFAEALRAPTMAMG